MQTQTQWLASQDGQVWQWEKVEHTFLNEDTGEVHCSKCGVSEKVGSNRSRSFVIHIRLQDAFERFTERHLHQD